MADNVIHRPRVVDVKAAYCVAGTVYGESDEDDYKSRWVEGLAKYGAEFDRWLRQVKADAWDEGVKAEQQRALRQEDAFAAGLGHIVPDPRNPYLDAQMEEP